jgi:hypothetical protein
MMTKVCEKCDKEMRLVPAGTSKKTGKPYSAFWSCDARSGGCGATARAEGEAAAGSSGMGYDPGFGGFGAAASGPTSNDRLAAMEAKIDELLELVRAMKE